MKSTLPAHQYIEYKEQLSQIKELLINIEYNVHLLYIQIIIIRLSSSAIYEHIQQQQYVDMDNNMDMITKQDFIDIINNSSTSTTNANGTSNANGVSNVNNQFITTSALQLQLQYDTLYINIQDYYYYHTNIENVIKLLYKCVSMNTQLLALPIHIMVIHTLIHRYIYI